MSAELQESSSEKSFDSQFSNRQKHEFPDFTVQTVDVIPESLRDEVPIILVPGWSENPSTYKKSLEQIYSEDRRGITIGFDRDKFPVEKKDNLPEIELRKAEQILGALSAKGLDQVDAIFHSEGAINGLIAATLRSDLFRNIVLDKPAGLIGEDAKTKLVGRFLKLMINETFPRTKKSLSDPNNTIMASSRVLRYFATNPMGALSELELLTTTDITDLIHGLEGQGVTISIVSSVGDPLFPVKRQISHLLDTQNRKGENIPIEGYISVIGGHNELSLDEKKHTALALDLFNGMQRRRKAGRHAVSYEAEVSPYYLTKLQTFETQHGNAVFRDIIPKRIRENGGEIPLVMMLGWTNKQSIVENTVSGLFHDFGQRTIPFDIEGGGKGVKIEGTTSSEINRQALILKEWILNRPEEKINLLGQSMSSLTVLALLDNYPEMADRINSLIFVSPMGFSGKTGLKTLASKFLAEAKRNSRRKKNAEDYRLEPKVVESFTSSLKGHPIRHVKELLAMAKADDYEILYQLKERGIKVAVIEGLDDLLADTESFSAQITNRASESVTRPLTQDEFDSDPGFADRGFKVGDPVWNEKVRDDRKPPIDVVRVVEVGMDGKGRGHGISGPRKFAKSIIKTLDRLESPRTLDEVIAFTQEGHKVR